MGGWGKEDEGVGRTEGGVSERVGEEGAVGSVEEGEAGGSNEVR